MLKNHLIAMLLTQDGRKYCLLFVTSSAPSVCASRIKEGSWRKNPLKISVELYSGTNFREVNEFIIESSDTVTVTKM